MRITSSYGVEIRKQNSALAGTVRMSNSELREVKTADCFQRPCLPDRAVGSAKARC